MTIEERYHAVRAAVRQLGLRDSLYVIWAYSQYLQVNAFRLPDDIEVNPTLLNAHPPQGVLAEWTLELLAREIIRHADEQPRRGQTLRRWNTLATVANALRDLEEEIYAQLVGGTRIHLELMRISHRQFVWQQHRFNWRLAIRYYKLFNTPEISAYTRQATGISLEHIYLIGLSYLGSFVEHPRIARRASIEITGLTQVHLEQFLSFTSLSRRQLSARLRAEHSLDEKFAYSYSSLREFPLVLISCQGRDEIACPIPTLLFWRITSGLYYTLKNVRGFPTALGASFARYVGEVLGRRITTPTMSVLAEKEYRVGKLRKDTVDWIIQQDDEAALFLECKAMRLTWASKAGTVDLSALEQDIRKLAGAVLQVYKAIADYRAGRYPNLVFSETRKIYPAVVTLEDWFLFGFDLPNRLETAVRDIMKTAGLPLSWLEEIPFIVMSVHELEKAAGVINAVGIHPVISRKVTDPEFRRWNFDAYCNRNYPEVIRELQELFLDEYEAMFAGVC